MKIGAISILAVLLLSFNTIQVSAYSGSNFDTIDA